jgi:uncharacterized phage protein (TIGR01671 family)
MREIKFRAWDGDMMQHNIALDSHGWFSQQTGEGGDKVMQYTGLKDKNGKEIYEGDIVRTNHSFVEVGEVKFQLGQFIMKNHSLANSLPRLIENKWTLEILGNIYENPELLK